VPQVGRKLAGRLSLVPTARPLGGVLQTHELIVIVVTSSHAELAVRRFTGAIIRPAVREPGLCYHALALCLGIVLIGEQSRGQAPARLPRTANP
jgi:hypothetical protein